MPFQEGGTDAKYLAQRTAETIYLKDNLKKNGWILVGNVLNCNSVSMFIKLDFECINS